MASPFIAPDLPPELPLTQQQWQNDGLLRKQQRVFGVTAQALSRGLGLMEEPLQDMKHMCECDNALKSLTTSSPMRL